MLLRVEHDGAVGGLAATGFVLDEGTGFSSTLAFSDPAAARSSRLAATDFLVGPPEAGASLPPGLSFQATLSLANRGDLPLHATVFINFTSHGAKGRVEAASLALDPSQVFSVDLNKALAGAGIAGPVREADLDIVYDGPSGMLLSKLESRDAAGDFSYDYPVRDPEQAEHTGGSYPWRLDGGRRTVVHIKNTTEQIERALMQIRWPGGSYTPEALTLGPWESAALDLERLQASGEPDILGVALPDEFESGQVVWYAESHGSLIGRSEVRDDARGVASGFSCEPICCGLVRDSVYMDPGSAVDLVGNEGSPFTPWERRRDCYGNLFGPFDMTSQSNWESSDTSVATVSGSHVSCLSDGTAGITATFNSIAAFASYPSTCYAIVVPGVAGASIRVQAPRYVELIADTGQTRLVSCQYGGLSVQRDLTYQVLDFGHQPVHFPLPILEGIFDQTKTCSQGVQNLGGVTNPLGEFTDRLRVCDPINPCSISFEQAWVLAGFPCTSLSANCNVETLFNPVLMRQYEVFWNGGLSCGN